MPTKRSFIRMKIIKKLINVGVERGVATRIAQVVWPMMIVTVTNFEDFTRQQFEMFAKMPFLQIFQNCCLVKPSKLSQ